MYAIPSELEALERRVSRLGYSLQPMHVLGNTEFSRWLYARIVTRRLTLRCMLHDVDTRVYVYMHAVNGSMCHYVVSPPDQLYPRGSACDAVLTDPQLLRTLHTPVLTDMQWNKLLAEYDASKPNGWILACGLCGVAVGGFILYHADHMNGWMILAGLLLFLVGAVAAVCVTFDY